MSTRKFRRARKAVWSGLLVITGWWALWLAVVVSHCNAVP